MLTRAKTNQNQIIFIKKKIKKILLKKFLIHFFKKKKL
jgi:hypothetical protein